MSALENLLQKIEEAGLWEDPVELARGDFLKQAGSTDVDMYLVVSGCLRLFVMEEEEQTIRFGYEGNLVGALDSFLTQQASDIGIQALRKTVVRRVRRDALLDLAQSSEENQRGWIAILENFVVQQMERERDILTSSPLDRYQRVLARSPQLFQEVPMRYIASYLRMTPETLSRIRKA